MADYSVYAESILETTHDTSIPDVGASASAIFTFSASQVHDLDGKVAIVTEATSDLARVTARVLAAAGAHVVLAVRDSVRGRQAAVGIHGSREVWELDITDLGSIRRFVARWHGNVDLLINNSGIRSPGDERPTEADLMANYLGHFALTNMLLPSLRGRVVTVSPSHPGESSEINRQRLAYGDLEAFSKSRLATVLFTAELQRRLRAIGSPVVALSVYPGLGASVPPNPDLDALPILYAAVAEPLPGNSLVGPRGFTDIQDGLPPALVTRRPIPEGDQPAGRLWQLSEETTGVAFPRDVLRRRIALAQIGG